jgi:hypothetical protein
VVSRRATDPNASERADAPATDHHHDDKYSKLDHHHDTVYALILHYHDDRYSQLGHRHDDEYAPAGHLHDDRYSLLGHTHEGVYSPVSHNHDERYSLLGHLHDDRYALISHTHDASAIVSGVLHLDRIPTIPYTKTDFANQNLLTTSNVQFGNISGAAGTFTGDVGIGTATAGDKLDVVGAIRSSLGYKVGSDTIVDSYRNGIFNSLRSTTGKFYVDETRMFVRNQTDSVYRGISVLDLQIGDNTAIDSNRNAYLVSATADGFVSGWTGSGWRFTANADGELNNLRIRGRLDVYELLINQIRATNGNLFVTSAGRVATVTDLGGWFYALTFEDNIVPFAQDDLLRAQRFTGSGVYQSNVSVYSIAGNVVEVYRESGDPPAVGMDYVRIGNYTAASRQGTIYLSADDSDAPFIDVVDGIGNYSHWNTAGKIKTRLGKLTGITGQANEYGIIAGSNGYGDNDSWFKVSTHGARLNNVDLKMYSGGVQYANITPAGGFLGAPERFSWNAEAVTVSGWILENGRLTKTIVPTLYKQITVNLRADESSGHAGLQILQEEDPSVSTSRNHITVGRIMSTAYSWTNRWGFAFLYRSGSTTERRLFEISIDTNGNRLAQIAGMNFDYTGLWTGTGSSFAGIQARVTDSTRVIFAGATNYTGSNASFYVLPTGQVVMTKATISTADSGSRVEMSTDKLRFFQLQSGTEREMYIAPRFVDSEYYTCLDFRNVHGYRFEWYTAWSVPQVGWTLQLSSSSTNGSDLVLRGGGTSTTKAKMIADRFMFFGVPAASGMGGVARAPRWLGTWSLNPGSTQGLTPEDGDMYFNSNSMELRVYTNGSWKPAFVF